MRISTKGEYGVRAMLDLALHYGQGPISLKTVAERQDISDHYLEQLMATLRKAGLVSSVRGAQGGYELAKSPGEMVVGEIIRALEGPISPMPCVDQDGGQSCGHGEGCATRQLWKRLRDSMADVLDSTTLDDLKQQALAMGAGDDSFMYHI